MLKLPGDYRRSFIKGCFIGTLCGNLPFAIFLIVYFHLHEHIVCTEENNAGGVFLVSASSSRVRSLLNVTSTERRTVNQLEDIDTRQIVNARDYYTGNDQINLLTDRLIISGTLSIDGWWMSHTKWNVTMDCGDSEGQQRSAQCTQVFTAECKKQVTTAVYQFLPIENSSGIIGLDFEAKGSSLTNFKWNEDVKVLDKAVNSVQILLKYIDDSHEIVRLLYPVGNNNSLTSAGTTKMLPRTKQLKSITIMLTCYGYDGGASFHDIMVKPIFERSVLPSERRIRRRSITTCPHYYKQDEETPPFDVEKVLSLKQLHEEPNNLTLVTHLSIERMDILRKSLAVWTGFMSITLYIPIRKAKHENITESSLRQRSRQDLQDALTKEKLPDRISLVAVYARHVEDEYPINYMRNLAIKEVKTEYMFLLDVDFVPCPDFEKRFFKSLSLIKDKIPTVAYVVPVFEGNKQVTVADLPRTKGELKKMVRSDNSSIVPFAYYSSRQSHELTNYEKWYTSFTPYRVPLNEDTFEPYLILNTKVANLPMFDSRFSGYGFNKIQFTMELIVKGYIAQVLPNVWATHIYHRISSVKKQFLNSPTTRLQNRILRYEYIAEIMREYQVGDCAEGK